MQDKKINLSLPAFKCDTRLQPEVPIKVGMFMKLKICGPYPKIEVPESIQRILQENIQKLLVLNSRWIMIYP